MTKITESAYELSLHVLVQNIKDKIREVRRQGTVGMSKGNMKMIVNTRGLTIPQRPDVFARLFGEAVKMVKVKGFDLYD